MRRLIGILVAIILLQACAKSDGGKAGASAPATKPAPAAPNPPPNAETVSLDSGAQITIDRNNRMVYVEYKVDQYQMKFTLKTANLAWLPDGQDLHARCSSARAYVSMLRDDPQSGLSEPDYLPHQAGTFKLVADFSPQAQDVKKYLADHQLNYGVVARPSKIAIKDIVSPSLMLNHVNVEDLDKRLSSQDFALTLGELCDIDSPDTTFMLVDFGAPVKIVVENPFVAKPSAPAAH